MEQKLEKRIEELMKNYHPVVEESEESMTMEEAKRLVEGLLIHGHTEKEAFDCLKYCTVGEDSNDMVEKKGETLDEEILENSEDAKFYARTAVRKAGHTGMLMLALHIVEKVKRNDEDRKLANILYVASAVLFVLDDVGVLIYEIKKSLKRKKS